MVDRPGSGGGAWELAERLVRTIYRVVIAIISLYFYVSIPFLILVVVALMAGIFHLILRVGHVPLRLAPFIGLTALYTLYATVRSVFTRVKEAELGTAWEDQEPAWSLLPNLEALQSEMTSVVQKNVWERMRLAQASS